MLMESAKSDMVLQNGLLRKSYTLTSMRSTQQI